MTDSILYMDGWDYLPHAEATGSFSQFWDSDSWYGSVERMVTSPGRFNIGRCLHFRNNPAAAFGADWFKVLPARVEDVEICIRFALEMPAGQFTTNYGPALSLYDSITEMNLLTLLPYHLGSLAVTMPNKQSGGPNAILGGDAPFVGRSRPGIIKGATWHDIQMKVGLGLDGYVQVKCDGEIIIDLTHIDVKPGGPPALGQGYGFDTIRYRIGQDTGVTEYWIDDFVLHRITDAVAPYNDYLGNVRVGTTLPNATGDETDFTPVGAVQNWQAVTADYDMTVTDTTYVETDTVGDFDLYNFQANVPARAIFGVQLTCFYRQTDAIQLFSKNLLKTGGTIYEGVERGVAQTYVSRWTNWDLNPSTTVSWTNTDLADIQAGPKLERSE